MKTHFLILQEHSLFLQTSRETIYAICYKLIFSSLFSRKKDHPDQT